LICRLTSVIVAGLIVSGCGLSSLTSGLGGGMFGGKSKQARVDSVTKAELLAAAKADFSTTGSTGSMNVAHGCPRFMVWSRDKHLMTYEAGQVGDSLAVLHRGEITKTARECTIEPGRVTVKYGFSGRLLLGPKGKTGRVSLPIHVFVTDSKQQRIATEKLVVDVDISLNSPIAYFSQVRTVTFNVPEGSRPGEFEVFVGFERSAPAKPRAG